MMHVLIRPSLRSAFSLVELSIVLVILGLLVGGVLSGQSLIRAAELRSASSDISKYQAALHSFRDKYFAIPGDMNNATQFWGRQGAVGSCVTNSGAAVNSTTGVCDGSGNGKVDNWGITPNQNYEAFQVWRALTNAGLIEGSYSGIFQGPLGMVVGVTSPASKLTSSTGVVIMEMTPSSINFFPALYYTQDAGNIIAFVQADLTGSLTPEEAWNVDTKMDDGKPALGSIVAGNWDVCTTSATTNDFTGAYDFTVKSRACMLSRKNAI